METVNIGATVSSVTPKIFNLLVPRIQTINVGAANAKVELKEVSDPGTTVNLSGQTAGTLKLDFARYDKRFRFSMNFQCIQCRNGNWRRWPSRQTE